MLGAIANIKQQFDGVLAVLEPFRQHFRNKYAAWFPNVPAMPSSWRKRLSALVSSAEAIFLDAKTEADLAELPSPPEPSVTRKATGNLPASARYATGGPGQIGAKRARFEVVRISGSHHVMKHPDGRTVSVPVHNREMAKGTLRNILAIIGMTAMIRGHLPRYV
jgi:predicted RNA binding protein YcfA (HicA-like mRNA interferase family)